MGKTSHPDIKYDWYQSQSHIVINILAKNLKSENVRVELNNNKLSCYAKLADESDFYLHLDLAHGVTSQEMKFKVLSSKIEIRLQKTEDLYWSKLELPDGEVHADKNIRVYPSSKTPKDWDRIADAIQHDEKKPEGEEALNELFQKIYADGSDETKKAMNKSFSESGGTVLSTNWNDVAHKKIDVKPPDGLEYKKWD